MATWERSYRPPTRTQSGDWNQTNYWGEPAETGSSYSAQQIRDQREAEQPAAEAPPPATTSTAPPSGGGAAPSGGSPVTPTGQIAPAGTFNFAGLFNRPGGAKFTPVPLPGIPGGAPSFEAPDQALPNSAIRDSLMQALQDPLYGADDIAKMNEVDKEAMLAMTAQQKAAADQSFAGMGRFDSGARVGLNTDIDLAGQQQYLDAMRGNRLETIEANRAAQMQAAAALDAALNTELGRGIDTYNTEWSSYSNPYDLAMQKALAENQINLAGATFNEGQYQWDVGTMLDVMRFLEDQRQFGENLGYNYGALNYNGLLNMYR